MFFGGKNHNISLSALTGMLLLAVLLPGAQGGVENNPSNHGLMDSVKHYHKPLQEAAPLELLSSIKSHASTTPPEKGGQSVRPAAPQGREASLDPEAPRSNSHANVNHRITTVEEASQKAHREGIYAVILMVLASSRH